MRNILLGGLLALLPGCAGAEGTADWQGNSARSVSREALVVQDAAAWQQVWERVGTAAPSGLPDDQAAVAVFAGQKRTGGYSVEFTDVQRDENQTIVHYRIKMPSLTQMTTQVMTSPYAIKLVPHNGKPVVVQEVH